MNLIKPTIILLALLVTAFANAELRWDAALTGAHRSEGNADRNSARHPRETLEFFGLTSGMTVMEVAPGGGWYTEVLAVLMQNQAPILRHTARLMVVLTHDVHWAASSEN